MEITLAIEVFLLSIATGMTIRMIKFLFLGR